MKQVPVSYNFDDERAVPTVWRDTFRLIINALMSSNQRREIDVMGNVTFDDKAIETSLYQIQGYPASKVSLGPDTWTTSICRYEDEGWSVLIDLYVDAEVVVSDLVLGAKVKPADSSFSFDVGFVYVP